jgi:hypothetical protein
MSINTSQISAIVTDIVGLGFAGASIYGFTAGHLPAAELTTLTALTTFYLGLKFPNGSITFNAGNKSAQVTPKE